MSAQQPVLFPLPKTSALVQPVAPERPKGCTLIYEPRGRAREYAALACNIYRGCDHNCSYCWSPSVTHRTRSQFALSTTRPNFLRRLEREAAKYQAAGVTDRILLCFTCDPYQHLDIELGVTRKTIQTLHQHDLRVQVLTKGGSRALRDIDLFTDQDAFATTLTFLDDDGSMWWEPRAALPSDRISTIERFHDAGIPTWVSLEPVIDPASSLEIIRRTHGFVDLYRVGKLSYHLHAKEVDWAKFAIDVTGLLESFGYQQNYNCNTVTTGQFYIKRNLAAYLT